MFDRIIRLSVGNSVFVNLLFILVCGAGIAAAMKLPREQFPEVSLDIVSVDVRYPGSTAEDVEELVVRPIEEALREVNDVKQVESFAAEGTANITVTFNAGKDIQDGRSEVEKAVATVDDLPEDADTPQVREMKLELPVLAVSLLGDRTQYQLVDRIAEDLKNLPGVAAVRTEGMTEPRILVELDENRLRELKLRADQVAQSIRGAKASVPAGTVQGSGSEIFVKTDKRIQSAQDVAQIPLMRGSSLRIGDVALVREADEEPDTRFVVNEQPSVQFVVQREETADPLRIREAVIERLPELQSEIPDGLELVLTEDYTSVIRDRLRTVAINGASGAVLVVLVLFIVSGLRQALLALWGMPVSYLFATFFMDQIDITINVISTFGLLIATGIVVDDAIVVIENTQRHLEMGKSRVQAAIEGAKEILLPVTVAVATTCFAFMPLTMVGGTMGRIMKILPLTVIACLLGSLIEAIFILPGHLAHFASKDAQGGRTERVAEAMKRVYRPIVSFCISWRWILLPLSLAGFIGTVGLASKMPFQLGAPGKPFEVNVFYSLAAGSDRSMTFREGQKMLETIEEGLGDHILSTKMRVGSTRDQQSQFVNSGADRGSIRVEFKMSDELQAEYPAVAEKLKQQLFENPDLATYNMQEVQAGPPSGPELSVRVRGRDPDQIDKAVQDLKRFLRGKGGVSDIDDTRGSGKETLRIRVDQDKAALYGLSELDLANSVRAAIDGLVAAEVSIDEEKVEIVVRRSGGERLDREGISDLTLVSTTGQVLRFDQVATLERTREVDSIRRRDEQRMVSVTAELDTDVITGMAGAAMVKEHWEAELASVYPDLDIQFGGDDEDIKESLNDLPLAFVIALGLIYLVLALQFKSYLQPFIILCAVPFGIMGAVLGLYSMGYDLSLFALFGVIALTGIVVNDSLVMVDFINKRRDEGDSVKEAALQGALHRLRPIISTTLTTCFGLGPLAIGLGGQDQILAPMAISISAGLGISTALVLLIVPAVYVVLVGDLSFKRKGKAS